MIFITALSTLLIGVYVLLILRFRAAIRAASMSQEKKSTDKPFISILIPFKDEQYTLPLLLNDLASQDYPAALMELILVDDSSTDDSHRIASEIVSDFPIKARLLRNEGSGGKKRALALGVEASQHDLILQIDADCRCGPKCLSSMISVLDVNTMLVAGPVKMVSTGSMWSNFASLEFLSLQAISVASAHLGYPIMASGANLMFRKEVWGSQNIHTDRVSGDDTFLVQHARKLGGIRYTTDPDALVSTKAAGSLRELINQRSRWGGKSFSYPFFEAKMLAFYIAFFNLFLLLLLIFSLLYVECLLVLTIMLILKSVVDYPFLRLFAKKTKQEELLTGFLRATLLYPVYINLTGFKILFGSTEWKGSKLKPLTD